MSRKRDHRNLNKKNKKGNKNYGSVPSGRDQKKPNKKNKGGYKEQENTINVES